MSSSSPPTTQNQIDLTTIPIPQLSQLQSRLSQELEHLSTSYQRLRAAQTRFKDCIYSIKTGIQNASSSSANQILIPLTTSLYIPATLSRTPSTQNKVLVDVGTGFYVSKTTTEAIKFYEGKVDDLQKNLGNIEGAVGQKNENLRVVEDVLRGKVLAGEGGGGGKGDGEGED